MAADTQTMEPRTSQTPILDLRTVQTSAFKTLVEALKELLTDVNLEFDQDGLKIACPDTADVILVHLRLHAEKFEYYRCERPQILVGVNMINLHKLVKGANSGDTLTMRMYENDTNRLHIEFKNSEKNSRTSFALHVMDIDYTDILIPPERFPSVITLQSTDFQKICREMANITNKVDICRVGNRLIFKCVGDFCEQETELVDSTPRQNTSTDIVQGVFSLRYLSLFTKCTNLSNTVNLFMKDDYPMIVNYTVASLGQITLALAPQDEDER
jgi:proliferating cell nuclear antigen